MPSNEDIIEGLKNIKAYEAKVQYVMKNDKGEETEETKQWYSADKGVRVEFGDEVTKVYKDEKIYVKDTINNNEYELGQDMDIVHPLAFINNILAYPIKEGSISEGQEEWGDTIYIKADVELFLNNIFYFLFSFLSILSYLCNSFSSLVLNLASFINPNASFLLLTGKAQ